MPNLGRLAANDQVFINAANAYNSQYHLYPGDRDYILADMMKTWVLTETGGDAHLFATDPFHVDNPLDWKGANKDQYTDLTGPYEPMTPALSARAALQWLRHRGSLNGVFQGNDFALRRYNANSKIEPGSDGLPNDVWYPLHIRGLAHGAAEAVYPQTGGGSPDR
jgi:hypothetical protein